MLDARGKGSITMSQAPLAEGRLVIGNKRYSSWSLRGWLAVRLAGLDVAETVIPLAGGGNTPAVKAAAPSGSRTVRVPLDRAALLSLGRAGGAVTRRLAAFVEGRLPESS